METQISLVNPASFPKPKIQKHSSTLLMIHTGRTHAMHNKTLELSIHDHCIEILEVFSLQFNFSKGCTQKSIDTCIHSFYMLLLLTPDGELLVNCT